MTPTYQRISIVVEAAETGVNEAIALSVLAKLLVALQRDGVCPHLVCLELTEAPSS
jgi:hypothetical protein